MKERCFVREVQAEVFVHSPREAGEYLLQQVFTPFEQFEQEEIWVFTLNCRRRITHEFMVYRGTIQTVHSRPAELFPAAVRLSAWGILLAHNHPSGCSTPSGDDVEMQRRIRQAGGLLGIEVVDHLVVGRNAWTSLHELDR